MPLSVVVDSSKLGPDPTGLNVLECEPFRSFYRMLRIFCEYPLAGLWTPKSCSQSDAVAIVDDLRDIPSVGPDELSAQTVSSRVPFPFATNILTHVQHPFHCISATLATSPGGTGSGGSPTLSPVAVTRSAPSSPNRSSMPASNIALPGMGACSIGPSSIMEDLANAAGSTTDVCGGDARA